MYSTVKRSGPKKRHILVIHVQNNPGVLNRVSSLFRRRRFNIESISAGHTERADVTRITIEADSDQVNTDQLEKQLRKLIEVIEITEVDEKKATVREIALVKVRGAERARLEALIKKYGCRIASQSSECVTIEICTEPKKLDTLIARLKPFGVLELVRTGLAAVNRGLGLRTKG